MTTICLSQGGEHGMWVTVSYHGETEPIRLSIEAYDTELSVDLTFAEAQKIARVLDEHWMTREIKKHD